MPQGPHRRAPGALEFVRSFVNTRDIDASSDLLATRPSAASWLSSEAALPGATISEHARLRLVALREALRAIMRAHAGESLDAGSVAVLNSEIERSGVRLRFDPSGAKVISSAQPTTPAAALIEKILVAVLAASFDGTLQRLKACPLNTCGWAYYDHSRNGSSRWCSMQECGNRAKARSFRARRRTARRPA